MQQEEFTQIELYLNTKKKYIRIKHCDMEAIEENLHEIEKLDLDEINLNYLKQQLEYLKENCGLTEGNKLFELLLEIRFLLEESLPEIYEKIEIAKLKLLDCFEIVRKYTN